VEDLWGKLEEDDFVEAMTIARLLWMRRNKWVFDGQFTSPAQVLKQACEAWDSFATNLTQRTQAGQEPVRSMPKWIKPTQGEMKCNWDAAINSKKRGMGVGVVIRDDRGRVVAAKASFVSGIVNPIVAESMGAWQAVVMCCNLRFPLVVLEGDSLIVVSALNKEEPCWSSFGHIIEDIRAKLQDIPSVRVQHVPRDANKVAHVLAKAAISQMLDNS
jgi:ribonuclease HI